MTNIYSNPPKWYAFPEFSYNKDDYLIGLGQSMSLEDAEEMALADLSRVFRVKVKEYIASTNYFFRTNDYTTKEMSSRRMSELFSDNELINAKTDKTHRGEKTGKYYVVASMNKKETSSILESIINKNINNIEYHLNLVEQESDLIKKYSILKSALPELIEIAEENDIYIYQMYVLDNPKAANIDSTNEMTAAMLNYYAKDLLNQIKFDISIDDILMRNSFKKVLTDLGLYIPSGNAAYTIKYDLVIRKTSKVYSSYITIYDLYIYIINTKTQEEIKMFIFSGAKTGASEEDSIKNIRSNDLNEKILNDFKKEFKDFLDDK